MLMESGTETEEGQGSTFFSTYTGGRSEISGRRITKTKAVGPK